MSAQSGSSYSDTVEKEEKKCLSCGAKAYYSITSNKGDRHHRKECKFALERAIEFYKTDVSGMSLCDKSFATISQNAPVPDD